MFNGEMVGWALRTLATHLPVHTPPNRLLQSSVFLVGVIWETTHLIANYPHATGFETWWFYLPFAMGLALQTLRVPSSKIMIRRE